MPDRRQTGLMRETFAHEAILAMEADGDLRAPGAVITMELCGHWKHEPPCPLAPHHTSAERVDDGVRVRTLFAVEPERENEVREFIDRALALGQLDHPSGAATWWRLRSSQSSTVRAEEVEHAQRLTST